MSDTKYTEVVFKVEMTEIDFITAQGKSDRLKEYLKKGIYPSREAVDLAAKLGHINILDTIDQECELQSCSPSSFTNIKIGINFQGEMDLSIKASPFVRLFSLLPGIDTANYAIVNNKPELLAWLLVRNIIPEEEAITKAKCNKHKEVLLLLEEYKKDQHEKHILEGYNIFPHN